MNRLDCENQRRIEEMKKKAASTQMTKITEESSLHGTNDFSMQDLNSKRISPRSNHNNNTLMQVAHVRGNSQDSMGMSRPDLLPP